MTRHSVSEHNVYLSSDGRANGGPLPPLPPRVVQSTWSTLDNTTRLLSAAVSFFGAAVFVMAAVLRPYSSDGEPLTHGTHRQLGLPACHVQSLLGIPCPSCGMTTSVSLCMHGDFTAACRVNWAGVVVAVLGFVTACWLCLIAVTGRCPRRLTPDQAVQWLAIAGASAAVLRYLGVAGVGLWS
jgi:hypothetical protein